MKQKIILPAALGLTLIGGILFATTPVGAQSASAGTQTIIQRIAQKFNLNEADVKAVFDQNKVDKEAERKAALEQKLTQAVTDGKISDAQKQAILTKFGSLEANRTPGEFKNMTQQQRKQDMQQRKTDLENWASQNGINLQTLQSILGKAGGGMGRGHFMRGK